MKAKAFGGLGIAVFLCLLMALMPYSGVVENNEVEENTSFVEETQLDESEVQLRDKYDPYGFDTYDPLTEQVGMRDMNSKTYSIGEGKMQVVTSADPVHYMEDGTWQDIDMNFVTTENGWEVTSNVFETTIGTDVTQGVSVDFKSGADEIITGINPRVSMLTEDAKQVYDYKPFQGEGALVETGGNMLRYNIGDGFALDYTVSVDTLKQDLVIKERPMSELLEGMTWFGLTEEMVLPLGYGLFIDGNLLGEGEFVSTQSEITIAKLSNGEVLSIIPEPTVELPMVEGEEEIDGFYLGTFFISQVDGVITISTMVEVDWLLAEDRVFPIKIDPSLTTTTTAHGYCRTTYNYCGIRGSTSSYTRWGYSSSYYGKYAPWIKFNAPAIVAGSTVDDIELKIKLRRSSNTQGSWAQQNVETVIMQDCGTTGRANTANYAVTCTTDLIANSNLYPTSSTYWSGNNIPMTRSVYGSDGVGTNTWWGLGTSGTVVAGDVCNTAASCSAANSVANNVANVYLGGGGAVGAGFHFDASKTASSTANMVYQAYGSANYMSPQLILTYTPGADTDAPTMVSGAYDGVDSYVEGKRTFFAKFSDATGIDTSSGNEPTLSYSIDGTAQTPVVATAIGTCSNAYDGCWYSAQTVALSAGETISYEWSVKDTASTPNSATIGPYTFDVLDVTNAPSTDRKYQVLSEDVNSDDSYNAATNGYHYDRQMTYWEGDADEYLFEWDTSECGTTTTTSCFDEAAYGGSLYNPLWRLKWQGTPNVATVSSWNSNNLVGEMILNEAEGGPIDIDKQHGPGMGLLFAYDTTADNWAIMGIGDETGISERLNPATATVETTAQAAYWNFYDIAMHRIPMPADVEGTFGEFETDWTGTTYQTTKANWMCHGSHGYIYFFRTTGTSPSCYGAQTYVLNYKWSGFALGLIQYQNAAGTYQTSWADSKIAPDPDTFEPSLVHAPLADSHSKTRTFKFTVSDNGNPPSGIDVGTVVDEQPTLHYSINGGTWQSQLLTPEMAGTACAGVVCDWTYTLENLDRGDNVSYYATARDTSTVGGANGNSANVNTTSTYSFEVADPNLMFIVEWHDMSASSTTGCTFQAVLYDTTNEIEFKYSDECTGYMSGGNPYAYYNKAISGYQDQTRTYGDTMRDATTPWDNNNPHSTNFRINTGANGAHGWETFDRGLEELEDYDSHLEASGSSGTSGYYCTHPNFWNSYKDNCYVNIDMPDNFYFNYFGTEYNGSNNDSRVHISRLGMMQLYNNADTTVTSNFFYSWYSQMITLPKASGSTGYSYYGVENNYVQASSGAIAPYWHRYVSNVCYDNANYDCSVRTRLVPFEGKGIDITETQWGDQSFTELDSPVRINPSVGDYLSFRGDFTADPGVVFQVAAGKGISFDGSCTQFSAIGNDTDEGRIVFEGANGQEWKGLAFTGACVAPGGTDDRHTMMHVDFKNTSDAAIAAGSRHGNYNAGQPVANGNTGNFTMFDITFDNVAEGFKHGSGAGTVVEMTNYSISNADRSCFDFAKDTEATLTNGTLTNCNTQGVVGGGAIVSDQSTPSTSGSLTIHELDVTNTVGDFINVDFTAVHLVNVTSSGSSTTGYALKSAGFGTQGNSIQSEWCGAGNSCTHVENFDVTGYSSGIEIHSATSYALDNVDVDGNIIYKHEGTGIGAGPTSVDAVMKEITTSGNIHLYRTIPMSLNEISAGDLIFYSDAPSGFQASYSDVQLSGEFGISGGCSYNVGITDFSFRRAYFDCPIAGSNNNVRLAEGTIVHTVPNSLSTNVIYARHSTINMGETDIESLYVGGTHWSQTNVVAYASAGSNIRLFDVSLDNDDNQDGTLDGASSCSEIANCPATVFGGTVWYGGVAEVTVMKEIPKGSGTMVVQPDHYVTANYIDSANPTVELFPLGLALTNATGVADNVWVLIRDHSGNTATMHGLHAFGAGGVADLTPLDADYPGCTDANNDGSCDDPSQASFGAGDSITLYLEPEPVNLTAIGPGPITCQELGEHEDVGLLGDGGSTTGYDPGETFTFAAKVTLNSDMMLDGCNIVAKDQFKLQGSGSFVPTLTIGSTSTFSVIAADGTTGDLRSTTALNPGYVVVLGELIVTNGRITNLAYNANTGVAIDIGSDATLTTNGATITGLATNSPNNVLLRIGEDAIADIDGGSIIAGGAGIGLQFNEASTVANADNFTVKNADIGIDAVNANPSVWNYVLEDNEVGLNVVNNPPPPPPPPLCVLGGPGVYYGGYWGSPLSCTFNLPAGEEFELIVEQYGWGSETSVDVTKPDGTTDSFGPYYFSSYTTYDPLETYDVAGQYTIVLDDTWGDGGAKVTADYASDAGGEVDAGEVCSIGGTAWNPGFGSAGVSCTIPDGTDWAAPRTFSLELTTYSWAYEAYWTVEQSLDGGNSWTEVGSGGPYAYSNYQVYDLGSFTGTGRFKITNKDTYGDGGQRIVATLLPAASNLINFNEGQISGSDTGVTVGGLLGEATVGVFNNLNITGSGSSTGFEVVGQVGGITVDGLKITGGDTGIDVSSTSSGAISFTNVELNETTGTALHYQSDMAAPVSGTFGDNTGTAIKHGQFTTSDRTYDGLDLSGNAVGLAANGAGNIMITDSDFDNTMDVKITGSSIITFVDGTVNEDAAVDQIDVSGSGMFERARAFDYTYTADQGSGAAAVEEANVILLDAANGVASMGETDSSGEAGLLFNVYTVDKNGQDDKDLNGYTVATVAKIFTSTTVEDYRYAMTTVSLNDAPGNSGAEELTQNIDARVCDTFNSANYHHIQVCEGWSWSSYEVTRNARADGTGGTVMVYDYYNGIGRSSNNVDWSNKVVMLDSYRTYMEDTTNIDMTGATLLQTGGYIWNNQNYQSFWTTYPYQSSVTMEDTTFISLAVNDDAERLGWTLGQANTMDLFINNSVLNGIAGIPVSSYPAGPSGGAGNPNWEPSMEITNSTISFYEPMEVTGSTPISALHDICVMVGAPENTVSDNTFIDCPVGVMVGNYNSYYIANWPIEAGSRSVISDNEFIDTTGLDVWFTFFSYGEDVEIKDNEFKGTYPTMYGVYAQSQYSSGQIVTGNTFNNTLEPIYMRGSTDWTISQNTIYGVGDASYAGIYELDGYGVISDNTLIDADGGILVDGVTSPPPQNVNLCTIGRYSYSTFSSCSFALPAGSDVTVDIQSDYWSPYEGSAKILFPDGTETSFNSIPSNSDYTLATILASDWPNGGTVTIEVYDSYGDGGQGIDAYYVTGGAAASGVVITGNDISTSASRTAPSAVGIWIENCVGAAGVTSQTNTISVIENAIVANGCDINDKDSVLTAAGGTAGSTYSVDVNGDHYSPENTTVEAGDSVRWRAIDYYDSDNDGTGDQPHDVVSVDTDANGDPLFTSVNTLNLGASFVHQFTTVGTYEYYCSVHPWMRGNITVNPLTSTVASTAINVLGSLDDVTLDGTTVSGFGYALEMTAGAVHLTGDANLAGSINAISAEDSSITVDGAHLSSTHPTGTAMVVTGDSEMDFVDLSVSGYRGLDTDLDFNWNGGISTTTDATVITAATGAKIENMTWTDATTQIHARNYARILSVANSLDNSKLVVAPTAVIDEGNLFNLEITDDGADTTTDVGLAIQSTDDNRAEYASDAFRSGQMSANGDMSDWFGEYDNANAIFDDAMPGLMSTNAGHKVYTTWDNDNFYLAMTGADFDTAGDLEIYFDTRNTGTSQLSEGINSNDNLPFNADFAFVASDNANYGLKVPTILSGWVDLTSCTGLDATIGTSLLDTEIAIPWDCLDADGDEIRVLAFVKTGGSVVSAHPDATGTNQNGGTDFTDSLVLRLPSDDVQEGEDVEDHILIYRSYVGSTTPSDPKSYDVVVKIPATCAEDWEVVANVDVSATETFKEADIKRACPDFTGLGDLTVNEDSGMTQYNLLNYGTDVQDDDDTLSWTVVDSAQVGLDFPSEMLTYTLAGQLLDVEVMPDAHTEYHGAYNMVFEVCDSHGLCVDKPVAYNINNINDKPIINDGNTPTVFEITVDGTTWTNYRPEAGLEAGITFQLGNTADNGTNGLIWDMYDIESYGYEPNQVYTWTLNTGSNCDPIMTVELQDNKELVVTEVAGQEVGGNCTLTLGLSDGFDDADDLVMDLAIYPENDPVDILEWKSDICYVAGVATDLDATECDAAGGTIQQAVIADLNGNVPVDEWKITVTEDDESANNLTFDLSKMKFDRDHEPGQLEWTLVKLNNLCDYSNYFDSLTIVNDQLIMDLTKDATTTLGNTPYDIDYFNDQGVHQIAPASGEFCTIGLLLEDTENAPAQTPNYNMDPANYEQSSDYIEFGVKIVDVPESVPDFGFEFCTDVTCDEIGGFNFYGVDNVMKGTEVPTTVTINHNGNDPTANYNYDMMIEVCVYADTQEFVNCDYIAESDIPYGSSYDYTTNIVIEDNTTEVRAEMDVLTCVDEVCDTSKAPKDRFWQYGDLAAGTPEAHRCTILIDGYYQQQEAWSCPGKEGYSDFYPNGTLAATPFGAAPEQRSPMLEDRFWCNNLMTTNGVAETCNQIYLPPSPVDDFIITTNQSVPQTVDLIGSAAVPSFAPGMLVVGLVGMFVSALVLSSRREEEEEEMEENSLIEDEAAVSPVIATILMVAITVVLSGVVYVWAASLADTSAKGVPQFYMVKDAENALNLEDPYYSFTVQTSQVDLATQSMVVTVFYTNASGGAEIVSYNLADTTVYGFNPTNSDSLVTFGDKVEERGAGQKALSTFNTGDVIFVKTITEDGYDISDGFSIQIAYAPIVGGGSDGQSGALLATFDL